MGSGTLLLGVAFVRFPSLFPPVANNRSPICSIRSFTRRAQLWRRMDATQGFLVQRTCIVHLSILLCCSRFEYVTRQSYSWALLFSVQGTPVDTVVSDLASTWEALFLYDCIIFSFTMARTWNRRHNNGITRISVPVVRLVFRDGKSFDQLAGWLVVKSSSTGAIYFA